ncbi:MAG: NADH-quinone oxidoreductase subunit C [bacterium]
MEKGYSEEILNKIKERFPDTEIKIHSPRRTYLKIQREKVYDFARYLFLDLGFRLSIATGIDTRDGIEIIYHFSHDPSGTYYNIKTIVPKDDPKIKSLADFLPAANWIEREIHELLGVNFEGHPNLIPLLTAEDWPEGVYPLRRDYG